MPLRIAAGVMFLLGLIPGLPKFSFFLLAAVTAYLASRAPQIGSEETKPAEVVWRQKKPDAQQQIEALLKLDEISLEVGYGLVPLVDQGQGGQLLQRIRALRRHLALQLGFLVPSVHITDNLKLKPREYVVLLRGVQVAKWEMQQDRLLAISSEPTAQPIEGIATNEPAFGASAMWIVPGLQEQALATGYAVVDQTSVLATHLAEIIRQYAHELLTRQETKRLLDAFAETQPKLVDELVPRLLPSAKSRASYNNFSVNKFLSATSPPSSKPCWKPRHEQESFALVEACRQAHESFARGAAARRRPQT